MKSTFTLEVTVDSNATREQQLEAVMSRLTHPDSVARVYAWPVEITVSEVVIDVVRPNMTVAEMRKHVADAVVMLTTDLKGFDGDQPLSVLRAIAGKENMEKAQTELAAYASDIMGVTLDDVVFTDEDDQTAGTEEEDAENWNYVIMVRPANAPSSTPWKRLFAPDQGVLIYGSDAAAHERLQQCMAETSYDEWEYSLGFTSESPTMTDDHKPINQSPTSQWDPEKYVKSIENFKIGDRVEFAQDVRLKELLKSDTDRAGITHLQDYDIAINQGTWGTVIGISTTLPLHHPILVRLNNRADHTFHVSPVHIKHLRD